MDISLVVIIALMFILGKYVAQMSFDLKGWLPKCVLGICSGVFFWGAVMLTIVSVVKQKANLWSVEEFIFASFVALLASIIMMALLYVLQKGYNSTIKAG